MDTTKNILSYSNILSDMKTFKKRSSDPMDHPGTFYFKILFYFNNPGEVGGFTSNLLGLDGTEKETTDAETPVTHTSNSDSIGMQFGSEPAAISKNTAYNYLMMNGEYERAEYLKQFIYLLSEISSNEPWYFKSLDGIDGALDREYLKDFKLKEDGIINIKCLEDSEDMRISTLLNLYNSACYSQVWMKEIVPANLRKFDMGIYVFQAPVDGSRYSNAELSLKGVGGTSENATCQYFEFQNCEIDPQSFKAGWTGFDNTSGFGLEHTLSIKYDKCMVSGFNDQITKTIGDFVAADISDSYNISKYKESMESEPEYENIQTVTTDTPGADKSKERSANGHVDGYPITKSSMSYLGQAIDQTVAKATNLVKKTVTKAVLGNVYGFSISNIVSGANQLASGDIYSGASALINQVKKTANSVATGNVVSDVLPSLVDRNKKVTLGSVAKNLVRNL